MLPQNDLLHLMSGPQSCYLNPSVGPSNSPPMYGQALEAVLKMASAQPHALDIAKAHPFWELLMNQHQQRLAACVQPNNTQPKYVKPESMPTPYMTIPPLGIEKIDGASAQVVFNSHLSDKSWQPVGSDAAQSAIRSCVKQVVSSLVPSSQPISVTGQLNVTVGSGSFSVTMSETETSAIGCGLERPSGTEAAYLPTHRSSSSRRKSSNPTRFCSTSQPAHSPPMSVWATGNHHEPPMSPGTADSGVLDLSRSGSASHTSSSPITPTKVHESPSSSHLPLANWGLLQNYAAMLAQSSLSNVFQPTGSVDQLNQSPVKAKRSRAVSSVNKNRGIPRRPIANRLFPCNQCRERFASLQLLEQHTVQQHGSYRCHMCNNRFTQRSNLQRHALKHVGFKPFECALCPKSYFRKDHLMRHMEVAHPNIVARDHIIVHLTSSESLAYLDRLFEGEDCQMDATFDDGDQTTTQIEGDDTPVAARSEEAPRSDDRQEMEVETASDLRVSPVPEE